MTPRKKVMTHGVLAHTWVYDFIFCPSYEHNREAQASRYANKGERLRECAARSNRKGVIFISLLTPENPSDSPDHHLSEAENTGYCLLTYSISLVLPHSRSVYQLQWYPLPQQSDLQAVRR